MEYDDDQGFLTDKLSDPWVSIPYAVGSGLLAGMTPGTARVAQGMNTGLQLGLGAEKRDYERRQKQRLSESIGKMADAKVPVTSTKIGVDPETTQFKALDPNARLNDSLNGNPLSPPKPPPTFQTTEMKPAWTPQQQEYLKTLGAAGQGEKALTAMGSQIFREPAKPTSVRPGGALVDSSGKVLYQAPAADKVTWRPYQIDLGDKVESGMMSSAGEKRDMKISPKGAAPARIVSPEEQARINSQTAVNNARIRQLSTLTEISRTAKTQTTGQLAAALNSLKNMGEADLGDDPQRAELIKAAQTRVLEELARRSPEQKREAQLTADATNEMRKTAPQMSDFDFRDYLQTPRGKENLEKWKGYIRGRGQTKGRGIEAEAATGSEQAGTVFQRLPDPAKFKGRGLTNSDTGQQITSDGKVWRDSTGRMVPGNLERNIEY